MAINNATHQDDNTKSMLYEGASIVQLSTLFQMDKKDIVKKLMSLAPVGKRSSYPIYSIKEAARYLVEPRYDIDTYIQKMTHHDLPPLLRKEFWAAMRSRQLFEKESGDLWPTDTIINHLSEVFKTLKTSILLMADAVERETELTERQRQIIQNLIDGALTNLNESIKFNTSKHRTSVTEQAESEEL